MPHIRFPNTSLDDALCDIDYIDDAVNTHHAVTNVTTVLPPDIINKCIMYLSNTYTVDVNSERLFNLACSATQENKSSVIKLLRLGGW